MGDRDGDIWVGTHDGLILVNEGNIRVFNKSKGLPLNGAFRIIEDNHGYIWNV